MLRRAILSIVVAFLAGCASSPATHRVEHFDPSLLLPRSCKAEATQVQGVWYINVDRDPQQGEDDRRKFASGAFDARVTVWVTFDSGVQLVTVPIGASEDGASVDTGSVSTGRMITGEKISWVDQPKSCEAFSEPPTTALAQPVIRLSNERVVSRKPIAA